MDEQTFNKDVKLTPEYDSIRENLIEKGFVSPQTERLVFNKEEHSENAVAIANELSSVIEQLVAEMVWLQNTVIVYQVSTPDDTSNK